MNTLLNILKNMIITSQKVNLKVFNDSQYSPYVTFKLSDKKTMIFRQNFLKKR